MSGNPNESRFLDLTAAIVSAHVSKNAVPVEVLPSLIRSVFAALTGASKAVETPEKPQPAVPIKRSVFPDYIVCLEDGKKLKMLKRHLSAAYQMTPAQYRERWGLPADYPMVASNYAERRSDLARQIGLGRKPAVAATPAASKTSGRGRKKAT